jgi:hypothetical protein
VAPGDRVTGSVYARRRFPPPIWEVPPPDDVVALGLRDADSSPYYGD